jgi:Flp pilus assembly protein TadG
MIEFTFAFLAFLVVFFAIIEFARALNVVVTLNTVAAAATRVGAAEDPLMSVKAAEVTSAAYQEFALYGYLDPAKLVVDSDVNYKTDVSGTEVWNTRVRLTYSFGPLLIPTIGGAGIDLSVTSVKTNELQLKR